MSISPSRCLRSWLLLLAGLSGCAETELTYTPLNVPPHDLKARRPDQIEVFSSGPPERPHVDVGLISVQQGEGNETPASLIAILRQSGAERGCDALLLAPSRSTTAATGPTYFGGSYQVYSATCIVYRTFEPGNVGVTFAPAEPSSTTVVDPAGPQPPAPARPRTCRDRSDFDDTRNCILDTTSH
jgi:hypothetical protein